MRRIGKQKGLLFTLLVIVLFILMLGEVITYVVVNVNYDVLTQSASSAATQGAVVSLVSLSMTSMLHTSLAAALGTLEIIESNSMLSQGLIINNTQYSLTSLMTNGTLYGRNFGSYVDAALASNFSNSINSSLRLQGISVKLAGGNLTVFQGAPSTINASYYATALINTTSGSYTKPIRVSTSIQLNGTLDIIGAQRGMPATISIQNSLPKVIPVGNSYAIYGSTGRFSFVYGTVFANIFPSSTQLTCATLPSSAPTGQAALNYILVVYNAFNLNPNACGFGGVITEQNALPVGFNAPYLVYPTSNTFNSIWQNSNLSKVLLDGSSLAAYNITPLQSAIQNNKYFASPYVPSYIDQQGTFTRRPTNGLFSFGSLNRAAPVFQESQSSPSFMAANQLTLSNTFTISFWFNEGRWLGGCDNLIYFGNPGYNTFFDIRDAAASSPSSCAAGSAQNSSLSALYEFGGTLYGGSLSGVGPRYGTTGIAPNTWTQAAVVVSPGNLIWYLNGNLAGNFIITNPAAQSNSLVLGRGPSSSGSYGFNGSIAEVEVYNTPLSQFDIQTIYKEGITGIPTRTANLIAWYPLNGNPNDYSGHGNNANTVSVSYSTISGYYADPIYRNVFTNTTSYELPGIINCENINQCSTWNQSHMFLGGFPLSYAGSVAVNESAALGLGNAVLPDVLSFSNMLPTQSYGTNSYVGETNSISWAQTTNSWSMSIWVYPTSQNGIVVDEYNSVGSVSQPLISINNNKIYVSLEGSSLNCYLAKSNADYNWTNVGITYNPSGSPTFYWYVNGVQGAGASPSGFTLNKAVFFGLGKSDGTNCAGSAAQKNGFSGLMSSFQVYNSMLAANQMLSIYLNGSVNAGPAVAPNLNMPLGANFRNAPNRTTELVANDFGVFYQGNGVPCSVAGVVNETCGIWMTPT